VVLEVGEWCGFIEGAGVSLGVDAVEFVPEVGDVLADVRVLVGDEGDVVP
jgi:hypothetical protein